MPRNVDKSLVDFWLAIQYCQLPKYARLFWVSKQELNMYSLAWSSKWQCTLTLAVDCCHGRSKQVTRAKLGRHDCHDVYTCFQPHRQAAKQRLQSNTFSACAWSWTQAYCIPTTMNSDISPTNTCLNCLSHTSMYHLYTIYCCKWLTFDTTRLRFW